MAEETKDKKLVVTPKVLAKIKEWIDAGRKVYRFVCPHLGCLTEYFSPNLGTGCPNHAWKCGGDTPEGEVTLDILEAEPLICKPIMRKDIQCYWRESNQMSIVIEIPTHWRPIKAVSFGYIGGFMGMCESPTAIKREHGRRWPSKWFKEALADGTLEEILNRFGATLEKAPKTLEV